MYGRCCSAVYTMLVWPLSRDEQEIIRIVYIVRKDYTGTPVDLSHNVQWKDRKKLLQGCTQCLLNDESDKQ